MPTLSVFDKLLSPEELVLWNVGSWGGCVSNCVAGGAGSVRDGRARSKLAHHMRPRRSAGLEDTGRDNKGLQATRRTISRPRVSVSECL